MTGVDLDPVPELDEASQRVEETLSSLARVHREIGPGGVSHEERVAGEHEPGLRSPRAVADREAAVLRSVARGVDAAEDDLADRDLVAVLQRIVRILRLRRGMDADGKVVFEREPAVTRDVVGVGVGLDRPNEANSASLRFLEVLLDRERRIDDDCLPRASSPIRYEAHPSASSTNCVKITVPATVAPASAISLEVCGLRAARRPR